MGVVWTKEQEQVITLRDRNILVSAAAGSGKTAVLVARILAMVTDPVHPVNIDELLVVTFTRAAASEMKERIRKALEQRLMEEPDNEHLQRQSALIHHAQITTIDGFCGYVIQNFFHTIDLDPAYRIADDGEIKMLEGDTVREVLEEAYAACAEKQIVGEENGSEERKNDGKNDKKYDGKFDHIREQFINFTEQIAPGKNDKQLEDMILRLYHFACSDPYPEAWLDRCSEVYDVTKEQEINQLPWIRMQLEQAKLELTTARMMTEQCIQIANQPGGPYLYLPMLESDLELLEKLQSIDSYDAFAACISSAKFAMLSRKKDDSIDPTLRDAVKKQRDVVKKLLGEMAQKRFAAGISEIAEQMAWCREPVQVLVELTKLFGAAIAEKKRKKNLMDFSDLEHFALQILVKREGDFYVRTDAARELSAGFAEVMIDEYQDSNYIQENLLWAVSKVDEGVNNRFMVGDVKQSIYGFRMAKPELFLQKQQTYALEDAPEQRIDLHKNFRSRENILDTTNYIFRQLMMQGLGGIEYDKSEALYLGADYPPPATEHFCDTQLLLIDKNSPEFADQKEKSELIETEAYAVARHIESIVGTEKVWDKDLGSLRPVEYRDCVILLRTVSEWADIFSSVLQSQNIPAYATSKTGYFSTVEVETVMNYLHICDNPLQEIPFTAVLHSPIGGFSMEELARIKAGFPEEKIYDACKSYADRGEDRQIAGKLQSFLKELGQVRRRVSYTTIHELLEQILRETGYASYAAAMPGGPQRAANLQMLVEKALAYEKTSYRGLFNFIRYMEQIQKYEVDFGEVNVFGETADTVRIMSIHKSKGLEFPVVYVCGLGKQFNFMDSRSSVLMHADLGIGMDIVDVKLRSKTPTQLKRAIANQMMLETLSEELRVLYVALTRAREKLVLTALGAADRWKDGCERVTRDEKGHLSYTTLSHAKSYIDWILPCMQGHPCFDALEEYFQMNNPKDTWCYTDPSQISIRIQTPGNLVEEELLHGIQRGLAKEKLRSWGEEEPALEEEHNEIDARFSYVYPYEARAAIPVKMTVSELKKMGVSDEIIQESAPLFAEPDVVPLIPKFMQTENDEVQGAARGTVYHRVFEGMDYEKLMHQSADMVLQNQIARMVDAGKITEVDAKSIRRTDFVRFLESSIGRRMQQAAIAGRLKREQPFVIQIPASEADSSWATEETILVQGIIDAYFEEEGQLVIVDYKTDRVHDGTGRELVERYHKQLQYYQKALTQLTGVNVKEMVIYSVALGKVLTV